MNSSSDAPCSRHGEWLHLPQKTTGTTTAKRRPPYGRAPCTHEPGRSARPTRSERSRLLPAPRPRLRPNPAPETGGQVLLSETVQTLRPGAAYFGMLAGSSPWGRGRTCRSYFIRSTCACCSTTARGCTVRRNVLLTLMFRNRFSLQCRLQLPLSRRPSRYPLGDLTTACPRFGILRCPCLHMFAAKLGLPLHAVFSCTTSAFTPSASMTAASTSSQRGFHVGAEHNERSTPPLCPLPMPEGVSGSYSWPSRVHSGGSE